MRDITLRDMTYGEFQEQLVRHVMDEIKDETVISPLIYFPVVHERVEAFLIAHWHEAWQNCCYLTWDEWLSSTCYHIFEEEVVKDILETNRHLEPVSGAEEMKPV